MPNKRDDSTCHCGKPSAVRLNAVVNTLAVTTTPRISGAGGTVGVCLGCLKEMDVDTLDRIGLSLKRAGEVVIDELERRHTRKRRS